MKIDIEKIKRSKSTEELLQFSIINIDKPTGPTSFTISQFIKKSLNLSKTSHLGTLDPAVTGVLPVALNRACRLNEYMMHKDKVYIGIMRLHEEVEDNNLKNEMEQFEGDIKQLPPIRSRVKRAIRVRTINKFEILERDGKDVLFLSDVQAGTYIRKLIHDLGERIGGAHMLELRRVRAGIIKEDDKKYPSVKLYDFEKAVEEYSGGNDSKLRAMLIPGEVVSEFLPIFKLRKDVIKKVYSGSPIFPSFLEETDISQFNENEKACAFSGETFIGCYNIINKDNIFAKPEFVLN